MASAPKYLRVASRMTAISQPILPALGAHTDDRTHAWHVAAIRRTVAIALLLALASALVLTDLSRPQAIVFDETYFIPAAQRYLNGVFFLENHPPLGKLLVALGQKLAHPDAPSNEFLNDEKIQGDWPQGLDITGYRLAPAFFGILIPALLFMIGVLIFGNELYAFILALLVAFDNALLVQSRAALLDSILIFFCLATTLAFVYIAGRKRLSTTIFIALVALWGVLQGAAASVKLTGLYVATLAAIYGLQLLKRREMRRSVLFAVVFGIAAMATFGGIWQIHFALGGRLGENTYGISDTQKSILTGSITVDPLTRFAIQFKEGMSYSLHYGEGVPRLDLAKPGETGSPWFWWLAGGRAIDYRWETPDGVSYRYSYLIGNPVTWLISLLGVLAGTALVLADVLLRFLPVGRRRWLYTFVALYWSYMIPMMLITRVMYLYHYLPPMIVGIVLFGIVLWEAKMLSAHAKRDILVVSTILLLASFLALKPFTYYEPLTKAQFQARNVWPAWDLRCVNCSR